MDEKIIVCLKIIQEDRNKNRHYLYPDELPRGYNKSNIDYYKKLGILGKEGNVLHLTPLGYQTLNSAYSLEASRLSNKVNNESLKHTKIMKKVTITLFVLTLINVILVGVQIYLNLK